MTHLEFRKIIAMASTDPGIISPHSPGQATRKLSRNSSTTSSVVTSLSFITMDSLSSTIVTKRASTLNEKSIVQINVLSQIRRASIIDHYLDVCKKNVRCQ